MPVQTRDDIRNLFGRNQNLIDVALPIAFDLSAASQNVSDLVFVSGDGVYGKPRLTHKRLTYPTMGQHIDRDLRDFGHAEEGKRDEGAHAEYHPG